MKKEQDKEEDEEARERQLGHSTAASCWCELVRGLWCGDAFIIEHASHERTYLAQVLLAAIAELFLEQLQ